jgi:hypothetical protein
MRFQEFKLTESTLFESNRGIIGMVIDTQSGKGAYFTNPENQDVRATNAWKFPVDNNKLKYEPVQTIGKPKGKSAAGPSLTTPDEQFEKELDDTTGLNVNDIKWAGGSKFKTGFAALVVELTSSKGRVYVGKYFPKKQTSGHLFWQVSDFSRDLEVVGIKLQQKKAASSTGVSGAINLGPREVGVTGARMPIANVVKTVAKNIKNNSAIPEEEHETIVGLLKNLGAGPVKINPEHKANYEVQLGEVAAPIALFKGINISGSHMQAQEKLLDVLEPGLTWKGLVNVEYPTNVAEKLIDSYMYSSAGTKIGVSSKDKSGGASASITSITETIENKLAVIESRVPDFGRKYAKYIKYLEVMKNSTGATVAFNMGAHLKIISAKVAKQASDIIARNPGDVKALKAIDGGEFYSKMINYEGYKPVTTHQLYQPGWHCAASLARMCADKMNANLQETYRFFSTVLESANMVQVKTGFKAKGDQGEYASFEVIYPPVFDGVILFEAGSYFYATKKPAGFTFRYKPGVTSFH